MILALISLIFLFAIFIILNKQNKIKVFMLIIFLVTMVTTVGLCIKRPTMHNRISLNIIDYLIKFNSDASVTTTKQVTTEVYNEVKK